MKINSHLIIYVFICCLITSTTSIQAQTTEIKREKICICDDAAQWPPYTYYKRVDGKTTQKIVGFSVDVINQIFNKQHIRFKLELLPWKRCLSYVKKGVDYQMLLNASYNQERARDYLMSIAYYKTHSCYFYSKKQFPNGLDIKGKADLKKYKVGGILGYNYENYDLKPEQMDTGSHDYDSLIYKIHLKRCDLFVEKLEIIAGFAAIGKDYLSDPNLAYAPIPDVSDTPFFMMFPKTDSGAVLKQVIDQGITELKNKGKLDKMIQKYVKPIKTE